MKTKLYSLRPLFFTLFLLFGLGNTIHAQEFHLVTENVTDGGDGSLAETGEELRYWMVIVNGPYVMNDARLSCPIPAGTTYVPGTTTIDDMPVADVNNTMPFLTSTSIGNVAGGDMVTVKFRVKVTANYGTISNTASLQSSTLNTNSETKLTVIQSPINGCENFYALTTGSVYGYNPQFPNVYLPYSYVRRLNIATGVISPFYNGPGGESRNAITNATIPSVLTDAAAMASSSLTYPPRLYFVNRPVNNQPADLCYIQQAGGSAVGYKYVGVPLTNNVTSPITRMTFDASHNGYAITDNGQEFIHFTVNASTNIPVIDAGIPLTNDAANGAYNVLTETDGDICPDGSGRLLLIPQSGNVYRIDPTTKIAKYIGSITNMPAGGCKSVTIDNAGNIYIGGFYRDLYKLTLSTMTLATVTTTSSASSDFAGCIVPVQPARVATNENTVRNEPTAPLSNEVFAKVQPNPFKGMLNVQVKVNTAELVKVRLIDFYGRTVYTRTEKLNAGSNSLNITVPSALGSGMYVLELWAGNKQLLHKKMLKQ